MENSPSHSITQREFIEQNLKEACNYFMDKDGLEGSYPSF